MNKIEEYRVTEKLKKLLDRCSPNEKMLVIKKLKKLSLCAKLTSLITYGNKNHYYLIFKETGEASWNYTEEFYNELMKNKINNNICFLELE